MKDYRKKFILFYMISISLVLAVVMVGIFVYNYDEDYKAMKNTMTMVLEPYEDMESEDNETKPVHSPGKPSSDSTDSSDEKETSSDSSSPSSKNSPSSKSPKHNSSGTFTSVVYNTDDDSYSVISKKSLFEDEELASMISAVIDLDSNFGKVPGYNAFYYKNGGTDTAKISFVGGSYFYTPLIKLFLLLFAIFIISNIIFLIISFKLSKIAVRPLVQSIEMQQQFITDVSHDLKTPITIILANNTILSQHSEDRIADQLQWVKNTNEAAKGMLAMINEMLTLSSVEKQPGKEEFIDLDATAIITQAELQMESIAYEKQIELEADIEEGLVIKGKKDYLKRIISSLLDNALKYEPAGGKIYCKAVQLSHGVEISVRNCSAYISENELPHLFERFYQADSARTKSNSFGLGLSITKAMTEAMGGTITVVSDETNGTCFKVIFTK